MCETVYNLPRWMMPIIRAHLRTAFLTFGIIMCTLSLINISNYSEDVTVSSKKINVYDGKKYYIYENNSLPTVLSIAELRIKLIEKKIQRLSHKINGQGERRVSFESPLEPNYNVHIFYYAWYKSPPIDRKLKYWNDERKMINSTKNFNSWPTVTNYYPQLGFYSSRNATIVEQHMQQLRRIGAGVVLVTWYPPEIDDSPDDNLPLLMDIAAKYNIKIALHIKSYSNRNPANLFKHIKQFIDTFQFHKALFRLSTNNHLLPVYYIYDAQDTDSTSWKELLSTEGNLSIRKTKYDGIFIGLLSNLEQRSEIKRSGFDGFYTYFASNGITYGASWKNWKSLSKYADQNSLIFVPCVSPGYSEGPLDTYTRHRLHGNYYDVGWRSAIAANTLLVAITSFNAWNEGSQIEPAIPRAINGYRYMDYEPERPHFYLDLTGWWISRF